MHFLRALLSDFIATGPEPAVQARVEAFVAWAEADLAKYPLSSAQSEPGRLVLNRVAPRECSVMAMGIRMPETLFAPVEVTASSQHLPGVHTTAMRSAVSVFGAE